MDEEMYYEHPTQLRYWDTEKKDWIGGIGYQDYVISGITGKALTVREIISKAREYRIEPDNAIVELSWIDLSLTIRGV